MMDLKDVVMTLSVLLALWVYFTNTKNYQRQLTADNALRFIAAHQKLVDTKFLSENRDKLESGAFHRDTPNAEEDKKFIELLRAFEQIALLQKAKAIPESANTYMFGWIAQKIEPILTQDERDDDYWVVAVEFIKNMKSLADDLDKKTKIERVQYFQNINFDK